MKTTVGSKGAIFKKEALQKELAKRGINLKITVPDETYLYVILDDSYEHGFQIWNNDHAYERYQLANDYHYMFHVLLTQKVFWNEVDLFMLKQDETVISILQEIEKSKDTKFAYDMLEALPKQFELPYNEGGNTVAVSGLNIIWVGANGVKVFTPKADLLYGDTLSPRFDFYVKVSVLSQDDMKTILESIKK